MLKRFNLPDSPLETALMLTSDRWKVLIVQELLTGTKRFGELRRALAGISPKVLTDHLRIMEEYGLVSRTVYAEMPPRVEYSLTRLGQSISAIHHAMRRWGERFQNKDGNRDEQTHIAWVQDLAEHGQKPVPAAYQCRMLLYTV
ncbi:MAG: helix-turn-helix transcriptional regulator [Treponema sp.]|jgi:DNA-binding HxlR family transcriptional regulator|nr:helix-turn-helix transcriptional regulator [Treponema sp.]